MKVAPCVRSTCARVGLHGRTPGGALDGGGEVRGEISPEADAAGPRSTACFCGPSRLALDGREVEGLLPLDGGGEVRGEISPEADAAGPRSMLYFRRARTQGGGNAGGSTRTLDVTVRGYARTHPPRSTLDTLDGAVRSAPRSLPRG
ncbi:hypothetical protein [Polyangium jinanense]|uniref:Uncharacterized protein n=1 Tax=Polyangium jinanense TaxID=2829994 RepID=A0A9X4AWY6_9BACT|nr:hypothetical protein [Polyangium jinanense]MDC3985792.1 hypothetical protein [Polyangium jinanense]